MLIRYLYVDIGLQGVHRRRAIDADVDVGLAAAGVRGAGLSAAAPRTQGVARGHP